MRPWILFVALVGGCGTVTGSGGDAGPDIDPTTPDASPDARPEGPPTASVTFSYGGQVIVGATALLTDSSGAVVKEVLTGTDGVATFEGVLGGQGITVGKRLGTVTRVVTVLGIQPGDALRVGDFTDAGITRISVTVPAVAGANRFRVGDGCAFADATPAASGSTVMTLDAHNECRDSSGGWTLLATAEKEFTSVLKYAKVRATGTTATVPAWTDAAYDETEVSYASAPAAMKSVTVRLDFHYPALGTALQASPGVPDGIFKFRYPRGVLDKVRYTVEGTFATETGSTVFRVIDPTPVDGSINLGALALPAIASVAGNLTDVARPSFTWPAPADGVDMVQVSARWQHNGTTDLDWQVYAPPSTKTVTYPAVPVADVDLVPPAVGAIEKLAVVVSHVDTVAPSWDVARQDPVRVGLGRRSFRPFAAP